MRQVNFRMRARRLALIDRAALNAWNCNPVKRSVNLAPQSTCQLVSCRVNKCTLDARDFGSWQGAKTPCGRLHTRRSNAARSLKDPQMMCGYLRDRTLGESGMRKVALAGLLAALAGKVQAHDLMSLDDVMAAFGWDFEATEIEAQKVADGLHVFFGIGGNIAVSIGGDGVLIVDDQFPQMMPKIKAKIAELGGGNIDFAVNTHWHFDHAEGNLALGPEGSWLVAQANSRAMMAKANVINLVAMRYAQQAYPQEAWPAITFNDAMQFHFNDEQVDLLHFGPAHTTGDTAVFFRGSNAVHLGDVFNNAGYPFIDADNGGTLDGMIRFCAAVLAEIDENATVIPGHGPVTDRQALADYIDMLQTVRGRIRSLMDAGADLEAALAAKPTAEFDEAYGDPANFINRAFTSLGKQEE